MTDKQVGLYFRGTRRCLKTDRGIKAYFKKDLAWSSRRVVKDSNGDLLLPSSFEAIKDIRELTVSKASIFKIY
jgi:hypothetical protein